MLPICRLPQSLVNKIAAGEVVERPASVVKELMENAVDAQATRIDVAVAAGGAEWIRVVDNGHGIAAEQLPLAVASHATSKLAEAEDLFRVRTLGFRGEALASIAEVSRMVIRSRTRDGDEGAELEVVGGQVGEVVPCSHPVGTTVEVQRLFFNTPVRRKFLRTTQTEFAHVSEAFTRIALGVPHVHCALQHNRRPVFELSVDDRWRERIARCFGRDLADHLIWVESTDDQVRLEGYVAEPTHSRSHNRMQYLFLNGRYIRDRSLQHALGEAYRGLLTTGRYPIAFLSLQMPPELVDVNVHPTKLEVRFQDAGRLYSQLLSTLRTKFLTTDLTPRGQADPEEDRSGGHDPSETLQHRQQLVDWAKGKVASWHATAGSFSSRSSTAETETESEASQSQPLRLQRLDSPVADVRAGWVEPRGGPSPETVSSAGPAAFRPDEEGPGRDADERASATSRPAALQVHNRYLVTETEEGVTIIDQHALHERILYEQLRRRVSAGAVETQMLLVPEPVDLTAQESAAALQHRQLLAQLGLKIEPFGGDTVLLVGFPAMLANFDPVEVLRELLDPLVHLEKLPDHDALLQRLLHTLACKGAVKAGDRLSAEEIGALLQQRHLVDDAHHCPHGRPTALVFTREELDKKFKRG